MNGLRGPSCCSLVGLLPFARFHDLVDGGSGWFGNLVGMSLTRRSRMRQTFESELLLTREIRLFNLNKALRGFEMDVYAM